MTRLQLVVLGLVAAAYSGLPLAGYVWDDHALIEHNRVLSDPTFAGVFRSDLWCCTVTNASGYYRPLLTITFLADRWLFGGGAGAAHVHSLLWHLLCVALVGALLRPRVGDVPAAVAALLFGIHPLQSEAIVWIAARNDLMAAAGVLGTLLAIDRGRYALAGVAALAGCLSKENAYLVLPMAWMWRRAWGERLDVRAGIAVATALLVALGARLQADLGGFEATHTGAFVTPARVRDAVVTVLGWLVWPWPLTTTATMYMPAPRPGAWPAAIAATGGIAWLVARGGARARWLLALAVLAYVPALNGVRWYGTLGERYLYLPLAFGVAAAVATVPRLRALPVAAGAVAIASLAALHVRVPDWASEEALFTAAVRRAPDAYAKNMLAVELQRQKRWPEAYALLLDAVEAAPLYTSPCGHLPSVAAEVIAPAEVADLVPGWIERGCRASKGFDGDVLLVYAAAGRWAEADEIVRTARISDPFRRISVVRGAIAAREMDWETMGDDVFAWPGGTSDYLDRVAAIALDRSDPTVAPRPGPL